MTHAEVGAWLATQGCFTLGTDAFFGRLPITPINACALRESGGSVQRRVFDGVAWETPTMQIIARNATYDGGRAVIQAIYDALVTIGNTDLSNVRYLTANCTMPALIEYDENAHPIFGFDVEFWKEPS